MREALADAGLAPADLGYVQYHGTSTLLNDRIETRATKIALGDARGAHSGQQREEPDRPSAGRLGSGRASRRRCSACSDGFLPPTINLETRRPGRATSTTSRTRRAPAEVEFALCNGIAFGSKNSALILRNGRAALRRGHELLGSPPASRARAPRRRRTSRPARPRRASPTSSGCTSRLGGRALVRRLLPAAPRGARRGRKKTPLVLDLGCGSGHVGRDLLAAADEAGTRRPRHRPRPQDVARAARGARDRRRRGRVPAPLRATGAWTSSCRLSSCTTSLRRKSAALLAEARRVARLGRRRARPDAPPARARRDLPRRARSPFGAGSPSPTGRRP